VAEAPSTTTNPAPDGLETIVTLTVFVEEAKFAVTVPGPPIVADVDAEPALVNVMDPVLLDHVEKM
jgi:hypothetical protein